MTPQQIEIRLRKFAHENDTDNYFNVSISTDTHEIQIEHIFLNILPNDGGFRLEANGIEYWPIGEPDEFQRIETMEVSE